MQVLREIDLATPASALPPAGSLPLAGTLPPAGPLPPAGSLPPAGTLPPADALPPAGALPPCDVPGQSAALPPGVAAPMTGVAALPPGVAARMPGGAASAQPAFAQFAQDIGPAAPSGAGWRLKQGAEWLLAAMVLAMAAPLLLAIALAIRVESPGPVFFRQPRFGRGGRVFAIHKFRTMRADRCDPGGTLQTAAGDPRVTRVGRFLRRSSLDELPQVLDVLRGEMSLIGPRAHPCGMRVEGRLCAAVVPWYHQRHVVAPGLTGWAQVNGSRGPVDSEGQLHRRVALDLDYIRRWSPGRDLAILAATVAVCLRGENAR